MIDIRYTQAWKILVAAAQMTISMSTFTLIALKIVPYPLQRFAELFPPFSVGSFSSELLILAVLIHILLLVFFGVAFWIRAFGFAAQLAFLLVVCSIAVQAVFDLVSDLLHRILLDFGVSKAVIPGEGESEAGFAIIALQQPLFVAVVLPTALAVFYSIARLVDSCDLENIAVRNLRREGRLPVIGVGLAIIYFFARCFNHVAHFVVPMTAQMLREERFEQEMRRDLSHVLKRILLPEAMISFVAKLVNQVGRTVSGCLLLGIEYVPMWSTQVVSVLLKGN